MAELNSLIKKRGVIKSQLTRHNKFSENIDINSITRAIISEVERRQIKVESLWIEYEAVQSQIEQHDESIDEASQESERSSAEETYYSIFRIFDSITIQKQKVDDARLNEDLDRERVAALLGDARPNSATSDNESINSQNSHRSISETQITQASATPIARNNLFYNIKLPQLSIPTFSGEMQNWLSFYDMFNSLIHENPNLTSIQKLQYLKASLNGDAKDILDSIEIRSSNYKVAISLLKERYEDTPRIINTHLKHLFEIETLQKESQGQLQSLLNNTLKHVQALKSLNQPTEHWDTILVYLTRTKLDPNTKRHWERQRASLSDAPTMKDMAMFLKNKCRELDALNTAKQSNFHNHKSPRYQSHVAASGAVPTQNQETLLAASPPVGKTFPCKVCLGNHAIYHCAKFLQMTAFERLNELSKLKLCKICFRDNHATRECNSYSNCRKCDGRHNTLLHLNNDHSNSITSNLSIIEDQSGSSNEPVQIQPTVANFCQFNLTHVLLPTAIANVIDDKGNDHEVRVLLDSGSQSNFIRCDTAQQLNLKTRKINHPISGINNSQFNVNHETTLTLYSKLNSFKCTITCLTIPEITHDLPQSRLEFGEFNIPNNLKLADPNFAIPNKISILVGADIFWRLMCIGQFSLGKNKPIAQKTQFGWVISGAIIQNPVRSMHSSSCMLTIKDYKQLDIQNQLAAFWNIEEDHDKPKANSQEEVECETLFTNTTSRETDGKFIVTLPFKNNINQLGHSFNIAKKRSLLLEQRLNSNVELKKQYSSFMQEYERLGHMTPVAYTEDQKQNAYFLPHHPVIKPDNLTTKLRVVFDASCHTSSGLSLNDTLKVGPVVQPELFSILMRFRLHKVAFTSDCEKMYRQIWVEKTQRIYQNIIWNNQTYQLNTLTYGTSSAPHLATRCIEQVAIDASHSNPAVSNLIRQSFYVDDLIASCETIEKAKLLVCQIHSLLLKYGFPLRKWSSNQPEVLDTVNSVDTIILPETKGSVTCLVQLTDDQLNSSLSTLISNNSNLLKLQRILAYCFRFIHNCNKNKLKINSALTVDELQHSLNTIIKSVQSESFSDEIQNLHKNINIANKSKLKSINPFLDNFEILRVGGRLRHSNLPSNIKFPIIIPKGHHFTNLIINKYHLLNFHAGLQVTLSAIRQNFWIISGKNAVKQLLHNCTRCKRFNAKPITPLMGDLPEARISPSRAFSICGTDFAGPFLTKNGRGSKVSKSYLCIFVCFSTKAVHLELVGSLNTESFLACLKRFIARRGFCREIHSDNGTNFVGANKEIKNWYKLNSDLTHKNVIADFLSKYSIQWKFIPARSPHFGGLWESVVKAAKRHLYKIAGNSAFTFEELNTLFCQIESILNCRPLIPMSSHPDDLHFLTPGHFLIGESLHAVPEPSLLEVKQNRLRRFEMVQQMHQRFWKLWTQDYLTQLQSRHKWQRNLKSNLTPGTFVLLREPNAPPLLWRAGRVVEVHPGPDGIVRVASIQTSTGIIKRSVTKLVELFSEVNNQPVSDA